MQINPDRQDLLTLVHSYATTLSYKFSSVRFGRSCYQYHLASRARIQLLLPVGISPVPDGTLQHLKAKRTYRSWASHAEVQGGSKCVPGRSCREKGSFRCYRIRRIAMRYSQRMPCGPRYRSFGLVLAPKTACFRLEVGQEVEQVVPISRFS